MGRPAVFCRFTGCNMWSGLEKDRANSVCDFCDTDFVGTNGVNGGKYRGAEELARKIDETWGQHSGKRYVVFTGGEPALQLDARLIAAIRDLKFEVAIETNGTRRVPDGVDWITVSPKSLSELVQRRGNELKLLFPFSIQPEQVADLDFEEFYLSPVNRDSDESARNLQAACDYVLANPKWQLTVQLHKMLGLP